MNAINQMNFDEANMDRGVSCTPGALQHACASNPFIPEALQFMKK
jgi:hypothetical protein